MKKVRKDFKELANRYGVAIMFLLILGIIALFVINKDFLENHIMDTTENATGITVTVLLTIIAGAFTYNQYRVAKRRGEIRIINLYYSITDSLKEQKKNFSRIVELSDDLFKKHKSEIIKEWKYVYSDFERVYELEKLLYEHGESGNDDYTKDTIILIRTILELMKLFNAVFDILEKDDCSITQNVPEYAKFMKKIEDYISVLDEYKSYL